MFNVLLVCTGNTCRSPMAAALLAHIAENAGAADKICVTSAGISAWQQPASPQAKAVMRRAGLNLDKHCSTQLDAAKLGEADLILAMTASHKRAIVGMAPEVRQKVFTLPEFAGETGDIADPFGGSEAEYGVCAKQLEHFLMATWGKIVILAGKK